MPGLARQQAERAVDGGVLLPDFVLLFDLPEFAGCTVGDVLADPDRYVGQTLADPQEGIEYGRGKAKVMQRADGSMWIHSFAHGRAVYELKLDTDRLRERLEKLSDGEVIPAFVRLVRRMADVAALDRLRIRKALRARLKVNAKEFDQQERLAIRAEDTEDAQLREAERQRQRAARGDFRPQRAVPPDDSPYLPVVAQLDDLFVAADVIEPPMRDIEGAMAAAMSRQIDGTHLLTTDGANAEEGPAERLPAPEHVLLTKLNNVETATTVERYIDYQDIDLAR